MFEKKDLGSSKSYFLAAGKAAGWDTDLRNKDPIDKDDNSQNKFAPFLIVLYALQSCYGLVPDLFQI